MERGAVCWVEVQDKVGWWPAQIISVPPRVPEGRLRVRLFGKGEEKEIEADSESMSFEEPGVGQNLQKAPAGDFLSKAAHAQFKSAVVEAQRCSKEGSALSEESEEEDAAEAEEEAEAQPQGRTTRKRKEAAPTMSVEGLPDGWVCSTHVTPSGQQYKRYKGPGGGRAQSLKQAWVLHDAEPTSPAGPEAVSAPVAASEVDDELAQDHPYWAEVEVVVDELVQDHPQPSELIGADVCVMAAAYPKDALSRRRAVVT